MNHVLSGKLFTNTHLQTSSGCVRIYLYMYGMELNKRIKLKKDETQ